MWVALSHNFMQLPTAASCFCRALSAAGEGPPVDGCATATSCASTSEHSSNAAKGRANIQASSVLCLTAIALDQIRNVAFILILFKDKVFVRACFGNGIAIGIGLCLNRQSGLGWFGWSTAP